MQAWHCLVIITITLCLFAFGMFRKDIVENTEYLRIDNDYVNDNQSQTLSKQGQSVTINQDRNESKDNLSGKILGSDAWAECVCILTVSMDNQWIIKYFSMIIESKVFREKIFISLNNKKTVAEQIFSPFESTFYNENKTEILGALFSTREIIDEKQSLSIICRGHSIQSANLLSKVLVETLHNVINEDNANNPILSHFSVQLLEIRNLESQIEELKLKLHGTIKDQTNNIESIAIQSEIMQLDEEFKEMKNILSKIENIKKRTKDINEFLKIEYIYNYGRIQSLDKLINELLMLKSNRQLDDFMSAQIEKNILSNSSLLEQEIIQSIDQIKNKVKSSITRRNELQKRTVDISHSSLTVLHNNPRYKLLMQLELELEDKSTRFNDSYSKWKSARNDYSITMISK